jgi:hypothetical protein
MRHATDGILRVRTLLEAWADAAHILWLHSPDSRTELLDLPRFSGQGNADRFRIR